jgi:hypothetical protein
VVVLSVLMAYKHFWPAKHFPKNCNCDGVHMILLGHHVNPLESSSLLGSK